MGRKASQIRFYNRRQSGVRRKADRAFGRGPVFTKRAGGASYAVWASLKPLSVGSCDSNGRGEDARILRAAVCFQQAALVKLCELRSALGYARQTCFSSKLL